MRSTHYIKKFKYKDKTFKFKEPLKIVIDNFIAYDLKTVRGELSIPDINDGYTDKEIKNPDKTIKEYLTYVFDEYLSKKDEELGKGDLEYKKRFINLIDLSKSK